VVEGLSTEFVIRELNSALLLPIEVAGFVIIVGVKGARELLLSEVFITTFVKLVLNELVIP